MAMEQEAIGIVARLMVLSARTAPKAKGVDAIVARVIPGDETARLANEMKSYGEVNSVRFFIRDAQAVAVADAVVLLGVRGCVSAGLNCGGCGHATCAEMEAAFAEKADSGTVFAGPNCVFRMADLGIAVGSAVKTAAMHNADNRVMYSAGAAALSLDLLDNATVALGIPLKAAGKNIFFDRGS